MIFFSLRNVGGISIAQYSYDNGDVKGTGDTPLIWNNEIINEGIGNGFKDVCQLKRTFLHILAR